MRDPRIAPFLPRAAPAQGGAVPGLISWPEAALLALLPALASSLWVGLITAHAGRLLPGVALVVGSLDLAAGLGLVWWLRREGRLDARGKAPAALALSAVCAISLRLALVVAPSAAWPALLDAGWYAGTGRLIAHEGRLGFAPGPESLLEDRSAFVADFAEQRAAGLTVPVDDARGRVGAALVAPAPRYDVLRPWHPPALATWLALWQRWSVADDGDPPPPGRALWPWAVAWLLAVAALAAQVGGPWAAVAAVAVAGLGPALTYYGAAPYAELPAGALVLGGLVALRRATERRRTSGAGIPEAPTPLAWSEDARLAMALLAGLALGMAGLLKLDLLPVAAFVALWWLQSPLRREPGSSAVGMGLVIGLALPLLHLLILGLPAGPTHVYLRVNLWGVARALGDLAWVGGLVAATALLMGAARFGLRASRRPKPEPAAASDGPGAPWRRAAGLAVLVLALLASWIVLATPDGAPAPMVGLLAWMVTPLAAWGAAAELAARLERPRARTESARPALDLRRDVLGPALVLALIPLVMPLVTRELSSLYVARRLVPIALPLTAVLAGAGAARLWEAPDRLRRWAAVAAVSLVAFTLANRAAPWSPGRELAGSTRLLERVADRLRPGDVLVLPSALGEDPVGRLGLGLRAVEGVEVVVVGGLDESPEALSAAVARWEALGRRVLWAGGGDPPRWPGVRAETFGREGIVSEVLAPDPALPPRWKRFEIALTLYELSARPARPGQDSG